MMKPNLFIVGAAKSGTTSLYNYLKQHPEVYMSPIKEPHYFSKDIKPNEFREEYRLKTNLVIKDYLGDLPLKEKHIAFIQNEKDYLELFRETKNEKIVGEASTGYLFSQIAAKEISRFNSNAKVIIILRDPVERALSHYYMDIASGRQKNKNILEALKKDYESKKKGWGISNLYLELSQYKPQVQRYVDNFKQKQILILKFSELQTDPSKVLLKVFDFLNVSDITINTSVNENKTLLPKNKFVNWLITNLNYRFKGKYLNKVSKLLKQILFKKPDKNLCEKVLKNISKLVYEDKVFYNSLFENK